MKGGALIKFHTVHCNAMEDLRTMALFKRLLHRQRSFITTLNGVSSLAVSSSSGFQWNRAYNRAAFSPSNS